jgi:N-acetylmuramoyl-L-alanine amidase
MCKRSLFLSLLLLMMTLAAAAAGSKFTLVVDAGHGGHDFGAPGAVSYEKNLTLKYALAFGRMVERNCPDVRVVYTRKTDVFIPLHKRADIANTEKADLFISFHINALDGNHTARGFQSYTLGRGERSGDKGLRENLEVAKRENSVIFLEKDYKTTYKGLDSNSAESDIMGEFIADKNRERSVDLSRLMQREVCRATGRPDGGSHQNNLAVLRLTSMPATLLELGFISTPEEEQFMNSDSALELYTQGFYNAFIRYKDKYDTHIDVPYRTSNSDISGQLVDVGQPALATLMDSDTSTSVGDSDVQAKPGRKREGGTETARKTETRASSRPVAPAPVTTAGPVDVAKPVFKIQILTSNNVLGAKDARFKGLTGCEYYDEAGTKKYTYGASNNYNEIYRLRKQLLDQFPDCFIIAFKNGSKIDVNAGIREFKSNR